MAKDSGNGKCATCKVTLRPSRMKRGMCCPLCGEVGGDLPLYFSAFDMEMDGRPGVGDIRNSSSNNNSQLNKICRTVLETATAENRRVISC
eukprot:g80927.t1